MLCDYLKKLKSKLKKKKCLIKFSKLIQNGFKKHILVIRKQIIDIHNINNNGKEPLKKKEKKH